MTATTTDAYDALARALTDADGKHPLLEPCPTCDGGGYVKRTGKDSFLPAFQGEQYARPHEHCHGTGQIPVPYRMAQVLAAMAQAGYNYTWVVLRGNDGFIHCAAVQFEKIGAPYTDEDQPSANISDPTEADAIDTAFLEACGAAVKGASDATDI